MGSGWVECPDDCWAGRKTWPERDWTEKVKGGSERAAAWDTSSFRASPFRWPGSAGDMQGGGHGLWRRISHQVDLIKNHSPFSNLHLQFSCSFGKRPRAAVPLREPLPGEPGSCARCLPAACLPDSCRTQSLLSPSFPNSRLLDLNCTGGQVREKAQAQAGSAGFPFLSWLKQDTTRSLIWALCQFWKDCVCHSSKKKKAGGYLAMDE